MGHKYVEGQDMAQEDRRADVKGILIVFCTIVAAAVYFVSGWAPGI